MVTLISILFIAGYLAIAMEHPLKVNKAASALITGALCWTVFALYSPDKEGTSHLVSEYLGEVAGILFFLLGARRKLDPFAPLTKSLMALSEGAGTV